MTGHEASSTVGTSAGSAPRPDVAVTGTPAPLSLTGVSRDGAALLLVDGLGAPFLLEITPGLRAALRGDASRIGKVETTMDSTLRPRDIQARIRAGESAEDVAEAAQTSVEKIMPFAGPVLAEREHVADRARRSNLRRPAGESAGTSRTLGDAVEAHLRSCNVDPDTVTWDAWRREDGRWSLTGDYASALRSGSAGFTFDARGNYVMLDNEDARWLVGESVASPAPARDDLRTARDRRLSSVSGDELPLGADTIEMVQGDPAPDPVERAHPVEASVSDTTIETVVEEQTLPLEAFFQDAATSHDPGPAAQAADQPPGESAEKPAEGTTARRPAQKKKGRASVPSWDEIMFGGPSEP